MDVADELKATLLPIPTEQRIDVFVVTPDEAMEKFWLHQGGNSRFHYPREGTQDLASFCGVALFKLFIPPHISTHHFALLQPFFARAGKEANVFEWDYIERKFVRRDEAWFDGRVASAITGCGMHSGEWWDATGWGYH